MVVLGYPDIAAAGDAVMDVVAHDPWQLEGMDEVLIEMEKQAHLAGDAIDMLPRGGGWLMIQFAGQDQDEADAKARKLLDDIEHGNHPPTAKFLDDPAKEDTLVEARESGLGATAHPRDSHITWPGWEDSAVPPQRLGDYLRDLRSLLDEFGYSKDETSLYGNFGQACIHTRIPFELRTVDGVAHFHDFTARAATWSPPTAGRCQGSTATGRLAQTCFPGCSGTRSWLCSVSSRPCSTPTTG